MDVAWRFRLMIFTALALMVFADYYGYGGGAGGSVRGIKSDANQAAATAAAASAAATTGKFQSNNAAATTAAAAAADIEISEAAASGAADPTDLDELAAMAMKNKRDLAKLQLTDAIKESCLPKMLCEMAAKPDYMLNEKEKDLLQLIRSSTMSLAMNGAPSKWHFAAHMGELLRYTGDDLSGPMGCANLWPNCPISSKKLMKLSYKVKL